jgi:hypothetical protein
VFYIVLIPFIIGGGLSALPYHLALLAGGLITFVLRLHPRTRANPTAILVGTACLLATIAHAFSPLLVTPALAVMSAMTLIVSPKFSPRATALAMVLLFASVFLPWLGEGIGLLPQTISVTSDAIILSGPVMTLPVALKIPVLVILFAGVLGAGVTYAQSLRRNDRAVRERLHMQSWQLRHLVPKA